MNLPKTSSTSGFHFNTMYSKNQSTKNMKWFILHGAQFYPSTTILLSYHYFILLPLYHFPTTISPSYHYFTLLPQFFLNLNSYLILFFHPHTNFTILPLYYPSTTISPYNHMGMRMLQTFLSLPFRPILSSLWNKMSAQYKRYVV